MRLIPNFLFIGLFGAIALGCYQSYSIGDDSDAGLGGKPRTAKTGGRGGFDTSAGGVGTSRVKPRDAGLMVTGSEGFGNPGYAGNRGRGGIGAGGWGSSGSGGRGWEPCDSDEGCDDFDSCTSDSCVFGECQYRTRDQDNDGYGDILCGGEDCNDLNPNVRPDYVEICDDGADNDCNGVSDCFDPVCEGDPDCGCRPSLFGEDCSNGVDDDCDTTVDCLDADCMGTMECGCAADEVGSCGDGIDNDCDNAVDCDDRDCDIDRLCGCQATSEQCRNGTDDDCDLLVDCADPDCVSEPDCICEPPGFTEDCSDNKDNDCDTLVDCADPDCLSSSACRVCTTEICDDGLDNNCDGRIDCADVACLFASNCALGPEICGNSLDDDRDLLIDCQDPDCVNNPYCVLKQSNCLSPRLIPESGSYFGDTTGNIGENQASCGGGAGEAVFYFVLTEASRVHLDSIGTSFDSVLYVRAGSCDHGAEIGCDDDSAGSEWAAALDFTILYPGVYFVFLDGFTVNDFDHGPFQLNVEIEPNPAENCSDGIDNDGDLYVDCADPDCVDIGDCFECNDGSPPIAEFGVAACTDGEDNDCDGLFDCDDDECSASDYYVTECCDGQDENGNGIIDDFSCRCVSDADCQGSHICYTHTTHSCGPPCMQFVGEVCPFAAPGSYCNTTTQQCEF